jgi:hypothetical protein
MHEFYSTQSPVSNPGDYAHLFDDMPRDLAGIARVTQGLVYHYMADQHIYGYQPPQDRMTEIDTRSMERILARLVELDSRPLTEARTYANRLIGCCRDFALLACAILRHQGRAARLRHGFAGYFVPDYWIDHVVVEVWDAARWRRFDPEMTERFPRVNGRQFDALDMPDGPFVTGGRAWQMCRGEGADPARFGLGPNVPDVSGWWFIQGRMQQDIAALNKQEMLCWDQWRFGEESSVVSPDDAVLLDRAAAFSSQPDSAALRALCAAEPRLQVPDTVTCFSPAVGPHPVQVG